MRGGNQEEDVEMCDSTEEISNFDNSMQVDAVKRLCTERSTSDSIENMNLSQVSLSTNDKPNFPIISGIENFKPTQLEIIEEGEFVWDLTDCYKSESSPVFSIGGTDWIINYNLTERTPNNFVIGLHLSPNTAKFPDVCAEFILGIYNPNLDESQKIKLSASSPNFKKNSLDSIFSSSPASKFNDSPPLNGHSQSSFHRFSKDEPDWGFNHFCSVKAIKNGIPELNVVPLASIEGKMEIIVKVRVVKDSTGVLWHNFTNYDSKSVTGYVGLLNQGATCYMNSFVQSIFLTNEFRSAVYRIPTETVSPTSSIPLALQRIFYKLQTSQSPPSTIEMTKSFGWDTTESFMQHDVQEFSRVLMDDLENKMKGSEVEGTVERLFRGKMKNVLKCTQVEYESVREESFYDLQLTIKGVKDLKESFERYVAAEMLSGDNQYRTDDFGLQDAKKFATFEHFPPVLHIHLERYAFDMIAEATVKIHDRFEFPTEIDLGPYLSETSPDHSVPQNYWLHSVLVHAGDGHGGHYFVYIRHPSKPNCWYKFDDTKVTPCTQNEAIDENFGGYEAVSSEESNELYRSTGIKPYRYKKFTSAYLLVYIRKCDLDTVMAPVEESHVPEYLVNRIKCDDIAESRRRYERQQQFLNMTAKILTDESLKNYSGPDICDPDSDDSVYKCRREASMEDICVDAIKAIEENSTSPSYYYGCDGYECYTLSSRRNKTIRPDIKLTELDSKTVGTYHSRINSSPATFYIRLTDTNAFTNGNLWRQPLTEGKQLIFVKWFDPEDDKLIILGSIPVERDQVIGSINDLILDKLRVIGLLKEDDVEFQFQLQYYEELKPVKIVPLDSSKSFKEADLRHGDILLVEKDGFDDDSSKLVSSSRTVVDYFGDLLCWRLVDLKALSPNQNQTEFENVKISTKWNLQQLTDFISSKLLVESDRIRLCFTSDSNCIESVGKQQSSATNNNNNKNNLGLPQFLKTDNEGTVKDFLIGTSSIDIVTIKYEITRKPISEVENQVRYFIESSGGGASVGDGLLPMVVYLPPYVSTITDLIKEIYYDKEGEGEGEKEIDYKRFRLFEVVNGKIKRTFSIGTCNESLTSIEPEKCSLYLDFEEISDDEEKGEDEEVMESKIISCFTFEKNPLKPFGIPFKIDIRPEESVKSLKTRISQRFNVPVEALFFMPGSRERKLEDPSEILYNLPGGKFTDEDQLGVMMSDPRKNRSTSGFDGAIRFRKKD